MNEISEIYVRTPPFGDLPQYMYWHFRIELSFDGQERIERLREKLSKEFMGARVSTSLSPLGVATLKIVKGDKNNALNQFRNVVNFLKTSEQEYGFKILKIQLPEKELSYRDNDIN